jgi:hypothetical protein
MSSGSEDSLSNPSTAASNVASSKVANRTSVAFFSSRVISSSSGMGTLAVRRVRAFGFVRAIAAPEAADQAAVICWLWIAEAAASAAYSASCHHAVKNIRVLAIVESRTVIAKLCPRAIIDTLVYHQTGPEVQTVVTRGRIHG